MLCFFMICVTIVCDADFEQYTASAQQMQTSIFHDGNRMSDEEFFGKWDAQANKWEVEGKIDYTYASELQYVRTSAKICARFVSSFIKSIPRPFNTSFSVARI